MSFGIMFRFTNTYDEGVIILIIVIIGVLGAMGIPRFINLSQPAKESVEKHIVGSIKMGITTYFVDPDRGNITSYPSSLDWSSIGDASASNPFFDQILEQSITNPDWRKTAPNTYLFVPTSNTWFYNVNTGIFNQP